jgi:putative ABC transport system permease protein
MRIVRRVAHWLRFRDRNAELNEELSFHRDALEHDLIARGHTPADARVAAQRAMGNEVYMREESRGVWLWPALEGVWQDAKGTFRGLRRSPAFTAGVMLTFALGVGANAAMFSLIDRLMLRPPALMRNPSSVHRVYMYRTRDGVETETGGQYARHMDLARFATSFAEIARYSWHQLPVGLGAAAREQPIGVVSAGFFDFFDAPPAAGRYFTEIEDSPPEGAAVAVLSWSMWQNQFGGRNDAIGSTMRIGARMYEVIGIAPGSFTGLWSLQPPVAFIPVAAYASSLGNSDWVNTYGMAFDLRTLVRRKPDVSVEDASADLSRAFLQSYRKQYSEEQRTLSLAELRPRAVASPVLLERGPGRSSVARVTTWLGGVTLIVLLIACANVASLLLARALNRRREIAVRIALGVSRARLLSQLLTESLLLAVFGSVLGLAVASWMSSTLTATFLPGTRRASIVTDARTLAFVAIITVAIGVFTGVLPVLQSLRLTVTDDLKSGARAGTYQRSRARSGLLVLQGALSLVLLVGAGLFVRSVQNVRDVRLGFDADSVLVVETELGSEVPDSARIVDQRQRLLAAALTVPGVTSASFQISVPFRGETSYPIFVEGIDSVEALGKFGLNSVSSEYFATMGTRILRGRGIERGDVDGAMRVMVIGESMGKALWPGEDPMGKCVRMMESTAPCSYVVGIAEDIHTQSIGPEDDYYYYYVAAAQHRPDVGGLVVRAGGDTRALIEPLRQRLQQEMSGTAYVTVDPLSDIVGDVTRSWMMGATVFTAFGVLALLLAAVGLYSVVAYDVAQRRRELAVRMAMGAAARDVLTLVVAGGVRFALYGIVAGTAIALIAARWIAPLLFDQRPDDPAVFGSVISALLLVAVGASAIPALRGARTDPATSLRAE